MKRKRLLSCILALLLVVSLLPMTVMAENNVMEGDVVPSNVGAIDNNYGQIDNNHGTVVNNNDGGTVVSNSSGGIVWNNNDGGTVVNNDNRCTVVNNNAGGTVENNNAGATVQYNYAGATVENNKVNATVKENYGLVGQKDGKGDLITDGTSGNSGKVENNQKGGVVVNNSGTVNNDEDRGIVSFNYSSGDGTNPGVINNGGFVGTNRNGGTVVNNEGGKVHNNTSSGDGTNPGVINNGGAVDANEGTVDNLAGQVYSNNEGGKILNNYGIVGELPGVTNPPQQYNCGTVETNHISGWVANNTYKGGVVEKNYGTVYDMKVGSNATFYGLHGEDENKETDTKYTEEGYSLGHTAGAEVNLDDTAASYQREGYKLSSYTVWTYDKDSTAADKLTQQTVADTTKYSINAPTLLKLVWETIASAVKPAASSDGGGEVVKTSYDPDYIGLGSVVTINGSRYKVVEIKDDAYVVVTFDALPDEDVKDLNALFAALFTPEQQKQIQNLGKLLNAEDVLSVFGKPGNHPVFEFSKDLLKK